MPREGEAQNVRLQVRPAIIDSRADTYNRGRITEEPCAAKVARTVLGSVPVTCESLCVITTATLVAHES